MSLYLEEKIELIEDKYPDQVAKLFEKFTSNSEFFGC